MTKERAQELLPFIAAIAEGKTVQFSHSSIPSRWRDCDEVMYQFTEFPASRLRIKPEPREFWIVIVRGWQGAPEHRCVYKSDAAALADGCGEIIHVREVPID